jgi:nitroreductase
MYARTFLPSLEARGVAAAPQTMLGYVAEPTRRVLALAEDRKLLFGISFGYPDVESPAYRYRQERDPFEQNVTFYD